MKRQAKNIVVAIPHSHTWLWTQTCLSALARNPPRAEGYDVDVVVVDNSPWSPAIRGIADTRLAEAALGYRAGAAAAKPVILDNYKTNKFHASALDCVVERFNFDYLMAMETDVLALRPNWLQWFVDQMRPTDYAVGMWHHEDFINPSCTLYRGAVLRDMLDWSRPGGPYKPGYAAPQDELRWGPDFSLSAPLDEGIRRAENPAAVITDMKGWIGGPFAEKRGWPDGTHLRESPSGQLKGPGWYEPGQQPHHWAVEHGCTYTVACATTTKRGDGVPVQTLYGPTIVEPGRQLEYDEMVGGAAAVHLWGGTRALDVIKHDVTCQFVRGNTPGWLAREARFWRSAVPMDVQARTIDLIKQYGWHYRGQGSDTITERDKEAACFVENCYKEGGGTIR